MSLMTGSPYYLIILIIQHILGFNNSEKSLSLLTESKAHIKLHLIQTMKTSFEFSMKFKFNKTILINLQSNLNLANFNWKYLNLKLTPNWKWKKTSILIIYRKYSIIILQIIYLFFMKNENMQIQSYSKLSFSYEVIFWK